MPSLVKIVIQDFRNIELQELEFSPNVNCITGGNGEGKTNLLDAIYYLSMTKSAFNSTDRFNCRHGTTGFALSGRYDFGNGVTSRFAIRVKDCSEKKMLRDDKPYARISEHIGLLPVVMVSPSDTSMVSDSGEERRKFVNAVLSQLDQEYLSDIQQYNRLLAQRNKLLKAGDCDLELLKTFDLTMEPFAGRIYSQRKKFIEDIIPDVCSHYSAISGGREAVGIEYHSDLDKTGLEELFERHRDRDRALGYTTSGIQKDDFIFTMEGHPIRRCGSQGQQKSFLVAMKFAQYDIMKRRCGFPPILLLDDLFDKLDPVRISNLLKMVAGNDFGQIFISDSNKSRTEETVSGITQACAYFEASAGQFTKRGGEL